MKIFLEYFSARSYLIPERLMEIKSPAKFVPITRDSTGRFGYGMLECDDENEMEKVLTVLVDLIIMDMTSDEFIEKIKETYVSYVQGPTDDITGQSINIYETRKLDDILERILE